MGDKKWTALIIFGILLLSGAILYFNNQKSTNEEVLNFGENATLYVSKGCPHCIKQLKILGECSNLTIIDCTKEPNKCIEAGIIRVPTWIINNQIYGGVKSIEELKELSNSCE